MFDWDLGGGIRYDSEEYQIEILKQDGGKGSGNFGHSGRKGKVGGSGKGGSEQKSIEAGARRVVKPTPAFLNSLKDHSIIKSIKDAKDAQQKLLDSGVADSVELDGLDSLPAAHVAAGILDMKRSFPDVSIESVSCDNISGGYGEFNYSTRELKLDSKRLNRNLEYAYGTGVHEYAHALDRYMSWQLYGVTDGYHKNVVKRALKNLNASRGKRADQLRFALGGLKDRKNDAELFARAFEKKLIERNDSLAEEIVRIVKEDYHAVRSKKI